MSHRTSAVMVLFHCESNTGYAIGRLEPVLFTVAMNLCNQDMQKVHFAYPSMRRGNPESLQTDFNQYVEIDSASNNKEHWSFIEKYIRQHQIGTLIGFDQPVHLPAYQYFRRGGVKKFVSYWGAPMSSLFGPIKLKLKQLEVAMRRHGPDRYIFESYGMAETATKGRGIPSSKTRVVHLGVNTDEFYPAANEIGYAYTELDIPSHRRIFFYSGHMEHRKGVWVIMAAANKLAASRQQDDWHILLTGNQPGEEQGLWEKLSPKAKQHVTFAGYRSDINRLHRSCYAGVIASTGWDSLTCSSLEMQASGLPLLCSDLPGLREAALPGFPALMFEPSNHLQLADRITELLDDQAFRNKVSELARSRIQKEFTVAIQALRLTQAVSD